MSTLPPRACRLRVRYAKDGRLSYLGHLELLETIMRCVRRSGLLFEVGNGFARRMRIQFSQALPVGASSRAEYYDLMLAEPLDVDDALASLKEGSPLAIRPNAAVLLPRKVPALEAWANLSVWEVSVRERGIDAACFGDRLDSLVRVGKICWMRGDKPKSLSLANTLVSCEATDVAGGVDLVLRTRSSNKGALRPAVLVRELCGCDPMRVCRASQWHENDDGTLTDPMSPL